MLTPAMRSRVDALWDKFWSGGIANPLTAIEQISYLLFMRRLDALDEKRRGDAEFTGAEFKSLFAGKYETRGGKKRAREELRWNKFRHLPAEEMLEHVRDNVFPFIKSLKNGGHVFGQYMQDAYHGRYYAKAQNQRHLLTAAYEDVFKSYDLIAMPTIPESQMPRYSPSAFPGVEFNEMPT